MLLKIQKYHIRFHLTSKIFLFIRFYVIRKEKYTKFVKLFFEKNIVVLKINVHKFGGAVLLEANSIRRMCEFAKNDNSKKVIIVSAIGKTSSNLKKSLLLAESGSLNKAIDVINSIFDLHIHIADDLLNEHQLNCFMKLKEQLFSECLKIVHSVSITQELSTRVSDKFIAKGEDLILTLIKCYFGSEKKRVEVFDSRQVIRTNSDYGSAKPDYSATELLIGNCLVPLFALYDTIFLQGFVASDANENTTTMGFESSNLTASIIAKYLNTNEITIWTDVDGIFDCDPKNFQNAALIHDLSYHTSYISAKAGLKLLYPEMIEIANERNIKIIYRNGNNLTDKFTVIKKESQSKSTLFVVINNKTATLIKIINPNKPKIIKFLIENYASQIQKSSLIIDSGDNEEIMVINIKAEADILTNKLIAGIR